VSDEAIALAFRTGLPFVGLRDHEHDPELDNLVPPDAARFARVLPLTAADDHVRLAVADPEPDLAVLTPYLEGRRVELAIAPRDELEEILGPAPPEPPAETPEPPEEPAEAEAPEAEASVAELAEPAAAPTEAIEEAAPEAEPEPAEAAAEPDAVAEPEAEPAAAEVAEPEPAPAEPEPAAPEPAAPAPPAPVEAPVVEHYAFAPGEPAGEAPSWLEPPPKRRWLRAIGRFLLYVLVLAAVCGAVAAYLLTR
jgi:Type II secretion system (T2SS), protein E, N-terminal domain